MDCILSNKFNGLGEIGLGERLGVGELGEFGLGERSRLKNSSLFTTSLLYT